MWHVQRWACEACTLENENEASNCAACAQPRKASRFYVCCISQAFYTSSYLISMIFKICALASSSGWECSACTLVNSSSDQLCSACERWVGCQPASNYFFQVWSLPCLVSHLFAHLKTFLFFRLKSFEKKSYYRPRQPEEDKFPPSKPGNWVCKVAVWFCLA